MYPIIIERKRDIPKKVKLVELQSNKTIFAFDIHKTTLKANGNPDLEVKKYITHLIHHKYNILFLSYDSNDERIQQNNKTLNQIPEYRKI